MTFKIPPERLNRPARAPTGHASTSAHCDETEQLLQMASLLGPRDLTALSCIIQRAGEICESHGEETALAVLDQIDAILRDRAPNA
ncbi:hypothetical protein [Phenylobacterium sp.]|uniref:hypothetical protein n=1 Tax=Phenylobacterium sp. TaxID=1871053 RepID=UPI002869FFD5|nr:hypothetical protein [Phenylobacterium sp.]